MTAERSTFLPLAGAVCAAGMLAAGVSLSAAFLLNPDSGVRIWAVLAAWAAGTVVSLPLAALAVSLGRGPLARLRSALERLLKKEPGAALPAASGDWAALQGVVQALVDDWKRQQGVAAGILGGLPSPYLMVDAQERAVATNAACLEMLELDGRPEDYLGQTLAQIFYNDPTRKTAVGRSINEGTVFRNLEVAIKGHKGGTRHVLANVFPLYDADRKCIGGFCLYLDMTALKEKEQEIVTRSESTGQAASRAETVAARLAASGEHLRSVVVETGQGGEIQSTRLAEAATAMEQMNASIMEVAKNASLASDNADSAHDRALQGAAIVDEAVQAIFAVAQQAAQLKESLGELGRQAEGIGAIMNVITDIADQTNLLALNAAIEAARAGDAGRGFAVVADEVRKLAEKTMNATKEVGGAIAAIQEGTRRNVTGMDGAVQAVEKSTELAGKAGAELKEIVGIVEITADRVRSIATASEEQSAASEQIARGVSEVTGISTRTAQAMKDSQVAVDELNALVNEVKEIIGQMRSC